MTSAVYEVAPLDGVWQIRLAGDSQSELAATRDQAIKRARELVGRYDTGRVVVRDASGAVDQEIVSAPQRG